MISKNNLSLTLESQPLQEAREPTRLPLLPILGKHEDLVGDGTAVQDRIPGDDLSACPQFIPPRWSQLLTAGDTEAIATREQNRKNVPIAPEA
jgi:hypothetical protein